jgi:hypothetical protein
VGLGAVRTAQRSNGLKQHLSHRFKVWRDSGVIALIRTRDTDDLPRRAAEPRLVGLDWHLDQIQVPACRSPQTPKRNVDSAISIIFCVG